MPISRPPLFEGLAVQIVEPARRRDVEERIARALGPGWRLRPFGDRGTDFEVVDGGRLPVGEAWQAAYRLRTIPGVAHAEPLFTVAVSAPPDEYDLARRRARGGGRARHLDASNDVRWSVVAVRAADAWAHFFSGSDAPASGIVVGHPDTGYRPHPEIAGAIRLDGARDFVDGDDDPTDPLVEDPGTLVPNPGHGTCTSSVIVSPRDAQGRYPTHDAEGRSGIYGVAPGARLVPLRVAPSVVLFSMTNLSRAIEHAADIGAHVVSISMGGLFSFRLRAAIAHAQKRGVIICAAAGNYVRFVVWPAAYEEVIAVAACNAELGIWKGSSRGSAVDVTAPGESVWRAHVVRDGQGVAHDVGRGSGTSYAVATVAGIAALWLARHGREALVERYGAEKIPAMFADILRASCTPVPGWSARRFGAGLANAEAALDAPLPDARTHAVRSAAAALETHPPVDRGGRATFAHLFEQSLPARSAGGARARGEGDPLDERLAELLRVPPRELPARLGEVGQELAFHLATEPALHDAFARALRAPGATARGVRARRAAPDVGAVRAGLAAADISPALRRRLGA